MTKAKIGKFSYGDTRRIDGDGTVYRWYIAVSGFVRQKFRTKKEAQEYLSAHYTR